METKQKIEEALKGLKEREKEKAKAQKTEHKEHREHKENREQSSEKLAVILVRGTIGIRPEIKATLFLMRLRKKNSCVVLEKNKSNLGKVFKVKDYVAYGEIDDETLKDLVAKRGKEGRKYFALNSPRKGFARRGIKTSFKRKGALGYRGSKINDLIRRML
jgi:large subunit ribosomal protein L30